MEFCLLKNELPTTVSITHSIGTTVIYHLEEKKSYVILICCYFNDIGIVYNMHQYSNDWIEEKFAFAVTSDSDESWISVCLCMHMSWNGRIEKDIWVLWGCIFNIWIVNNGWMEKQGSIYYMYKMIAFQLFNFSFSYPSNRISTYSVLTILIITVYYQLSCST